MNSSPCQAIDGGIPAVNRQNAQAEPALLGESASTRAEKIHEECEGQPAAIMRPEPFYSRVDEEKDTVPRVGIA